MVAVSAVWSYVDNLSSVDVVKIALTLLALGFVSGYLMRWVQLS